MGGDAGGSEGDSLCIEVPVVVELSLMDGSKLSESDSESDSLVELAGGMVSLWGRPRERGVAKMYSNGRRRWKMCRVTSGKKRQM